MEDQVLFWRVFRALVAMQREREETKRTEKRIDAALRVISDQKELMQDYMHHTFTERTLVIQKIDKQADRTNDPVLALAFTKLLVDYASTSPMPTFKEAATVIARSIAMHRIPEVALEPHFLPPTEQQPHQGKQPPQQQDTRA